MINVNNWISQKNQVVINCSDFYNTSPSIRICNETSFFYIPTGMTQKINQDKPPGYGSIKSKSIAFSSSSNEKIGFYSDDNVPLMFCRVPNSICRGVFGLSYSNEEDINFLITSGGLSGCTACAVYLPESKKIYFFHAGRTYNKNYKYNQMTKNADLCRSVLQFVSNDSSNSSQIPLEINDENMFSILSEICANHAEKCIIDVYTSNELAILDKSKIYTDDEIVQRKGKNYSLILRYYTNGANLFVSKYEGLYSVHYMIKNDSAKFDLYKRDNYEFNLIRRNLNDT